MGSKRLLNTIHLIKRKNKDLPDNTTTITSVSVRVDVIETRVKRTALSRSCPCPVFVRIFRKVLSGVCPVSRFCQNSLSGVCLSGFCLSRFCPVSGFCPDSDDFFCPVSVCPDFFCRVFVRCPDFVRIFKKNLSGVCLSGFLGNICLSGICPDFFLENIGSRLLLIVNLGT